MGRGKNNNSTDVGGNADAGDVEYVGITNDFDRRVADHHRREGFEQLEYGEIATDLTRREARAMEQTIINGGNLTPRGQPFRSGNGNLRNNINSISPSRWVYQPAIDWARTYMRRNNLGGFL